VALSLRSSSSPLSAFTYTRTLADIRSILIVRGELVAAIAVLYKAKFFAVPSLSEGSRSPLAFVITNPPDLATPVVTSASVESVTISFTSSYLSPSLIVRARFCGLAMINTALDVEGTLNALVLLGKLLISSSLNVTIFVTTLVLTCPSKNTAFTAVILLSSAVPLS